MSDIISAISTAMGVGGVAIIRMSGKGSIEIAEKMFYPLKKIKKFDPNVMYAGEIDGGDFRDFGMCVAFYAPHSFTGEDTVEFHCHGGIAITQGILRKTFSLGSRPATNGEFTKRAFVNGKLSLSSAEGLIDMINSESRAEVKAGYYLYREKLTSRILALQGALTDALAEIDANIDYPEEGLEEMATDKLKNAIDQTISELVSLKNSYTDGRKIKNGVKVALVGKPNTGKSSILNALLAYDKAIVTEIAGTTRDIVEGQVEIEGVRFYLSDTAGIRESDDLVEKIGIERTKKAVEESDLVLFIADGSVPLDNEDLQILDTVKDKPLIKVCNKSDLGCVLSEEFYDIILSAKSGNCEQLKKKIFSLGVGEQISLEADYLTEERHFNSIINALEAISKAREMLGNAPLDLIAYDVKECWNYLGEITGETASEAIIDQIFKKFCVGK